MLRMLSFRLVGRNLCPATVQRFYSGRPESVPVPATNVKNAKTTKITKENGDKATDKLTPKSNPLVSSAFNAIQNYELTENETKTKDALLETILKAKTVASILSASDSPNIQRNHALKVVSLLSDWTTLNRIKLEDFENDPRFIKLCRLLGRSVSSGRQMERMDAFQTQDLNLVLGVAGDDEAAKLISGISLPQMIKVMTQLAQQKRRSTPLLRSLAYNISGNSEQLNLKQCADLLYSMASLNFSDTVLIARIGIDITAGLAKNEDRPAVVGSIITSLGLMRFRDPDLLDILTAWTIQHSDICRPVDILSLFMTLASLNYQTLHAEELQEKLVKNITSTSFSHSIDWLNFVWSLFVLDFAKPHHAESVLRSEFIEELLAGADLKPTIKMKLLNINAAAKLLITGYTGPTLSPEDNIFSVPLGNSKSKTILLDALKDALKSLFTSEKLVKTDTNTQMGFLLDAECVLDSKRNPLPVDGEHKDAIKCALMVLEFHDFCQGVHNQPNGLTALTIRLIEKSGYKVLTFPHFEFNKAEKLLKRVQYLENKIKDAVK